MHVVITDLGFGDAGKGQTVAALSRLLNASMVVRFSGGPQAAHNVHSRWSNFHMTHAQTGSGTVNRVPTLLTGAMIVAPDLLENEIDHCRRTNYIAPVVWVDEWCLVNTPWHRAAQRMRERLRGPARHGSCGLGVGETRSRGDNGLRVMDLWYPAIAERKIRLLHNDIAVELGRFDDARLADPTWQRSWIERACAALVHRVVSPQTSVDIIKSHETVIWENSQGVLLDEDHGFHPFTTWSKVTDCIPAACLKDQDYISLGVVRTFMTRHGPGPFPSESAETAGLVPPTEDNAFGEWQGAFRYGWADLPMLSYAKRGMTKLDGLVVTHGDIEDREEWRVVRNYSGLEVELENKRGRELTHLLNHVELGLDGIRGSQIPQVLAEHLDVPLVAVSYGKDMEDFRTNGNFDDICAGRGNRCLVGTGEPGS